MLPRIEAEGEVRMADRSKRPSSCRILQRKRPQSEPLARFKQLEPEGSLQCHQVQQAQAAKLDDGDLVQCKGKIWANTMKSYLCS